jgi:hypothetical protein
MFIVMWNYSLLMHSPCSLQKHRHTSSTQNFSVLVVQQRHQIGINLKGLETIKDVQMDVMQPLAITPHHIMIDVT